MARTTRRIAEEVMLFLDRQRLDATPQNYTMGYHFVARTNELVAKAVGEITGDGIRITQAEADDIMQRLTIEGTANSAESASDEALRHQMLKLADITSNQSAATSRFGRDLTDGMSQMGEAAQNLTTIITSMIERTATVERELAQAAAETEKLRQDLDAARTDANMDALTHLPNRRAIDAKLAKMEKEGRSRTIAFCDVDRFKAVNDNYGHAVGDRVLQTVARHLKDECGGKATVARWGGEEFIVLFENLPVDEAAAIVDKARDSLSQKKFKLRETDQPMDMVSFSAGVASGSGTTLEITAEADALLYRAKEEGRNRIKAA